MNDIDIVSKFYNKKFVLENYGIDNQSLVKNTFFKSPIILSTLHLKLVLRNPYFNLSFYKENNPDVKGWGLNRIIKHYIKFGLKEGRIVSKKHAALVVKNESFDILFYKNYYEDIRHLKINDVISHYITEGKYQKRLINLKELEENNLLKIEYQFDQNYFDKFNSSEKIYYRFEEIIIINKKYKEFDFVIENYSKKYESDSALMMDKIYNHGPFRVLSNKEDILEYRKQFEKKYVIYNKNSFYELYPDFDLDYYKSKYFNKSTLSDIEIFHHYHFIGSKHRYTFSNKILIVMYCPPFDVECGGIVVMHNFIKLMNDLNHPNINAKLFMVNNLTYYNQFSTDFAKFSDITDNSIVIYPEIVSGNPLGAKNVMRWVLLNLGIEMPIDHYLNWSKDDMVYIWDVQNKGNPFIKQLSVPWLNPIFQNKNKNGSRIKTCFLVKKARLYPGFNEKYYIHDKRSVNLEELNLDEKIQVFNECKYFFCYDMHTAYVPFSILCGCIPIMYPYKNFTKESWLKGTMLYNNGKLYTKGIAWGASKNELQCACNTLNDACKDIKNLYKSYDDKVLLFMKDLENFFNENKFDNSVFNVFCNNEKIGEHEHEAQIEYNDIYTSINEFDS